MRDNHDNNFHWGSVAPEFRPASAISGQTFSTHEWTDVMPPGLMDSTNAWAQQFGCIAPTPGCPAGRPHPVASVNQVWSTAGNTSALFPGVRDNEGTSSCMGARAHGHVHTGWHSSAPPASTNPYLAYSGDEAMWPHSLGMAGSEGVCASTAHQMFGERVDFHAAAAGEQSFGRTSSSSTSETGGAESGSDGQGERTTGRFHWWANPASPDYTGDMPNG